MTITHQGAASTLPPATPPDPPSRQGPVLRHGLLAVYVLDAEARAARLAGPTVARIRSDADSLRQAAARRSRKASMTRAQG